MFMWYYNETLKLKAIIFPFLLSLRLSCTSWRDKMIHSVKRFKSRVKINASYYLRCGAKTLTFLFWATLYFVVMKMTIFKSSVSSPPKDWETVPDNYTKWLVNIAETRKIITSSCYTVIKLWYCTVSGASYRRRSRTRQLSVRMGRNR